MEKFFRVYFHKENSLNIFDRISLLSFLLLVDFYLNEDRSFVFLLESCHCVITISTCLTIRFVFWDRKGDNLRLLATVTQWILAFSFLSKILQPKNFLWSFTMSAQQFSIFVCECKIHSKDCWGWVFQTLFSASLLGTFLVLKCENFSSNNRFSCVSRAPN